MRIRVVCAFAILASTGLGQTTTDVGSGSPNDVIRGLFIAAYNRGGFSQLAGLPISPVRRFGATGLVQEFNDSSRVNGRMALVKASSLYSPEDPYGDVYQVTSDIYAYYGTVGSATAGYPLQDTRNCLIAACTYQTFSNRIVLFAYGSGANEPQNITLRDPFYTRWESLSGMSGLGAATSEERDVTSATGVAATAQTFSNGILFNFTSGAMTGRLISVRQPVWTLYQAQQAQSGSLGFPIGEELALQNGRKRQTFEGGAIEYDDASGPVLRLPVQALTVRPADSPIRLNLGEAITLQARLIGQDGSELTDRPVVFTTSNSRVATVQATGLTALVRAVGGGIANIQATSEGKSSAAIQVVVAAPCCSVGEGSPTLAVQQAFQDAVSRNRLTVRIPGPERVRRVGAGYIQEIVASEGARYLLAVSDRAGQGFVVTGPILSKYENLGGPASSVGYPASDATAGGRQMFEGGSLAGLPVRLVVGGLLQKWGLIGFETGTAGSPTAEAAAYLSFAGTSGTMQAFRQGLIASSPRGSYFMSGRIANRYTTMGGAAGSLGFPTGDEVGSGAIRRQEFEGGSMEYGPADAEVSVVVRERRPAVLATPTAVLPGSKLRLTVSGFPDGSNIRVSVTGQSDFVVRTANGSYIWDVYVPAGASPATVRIKAVSIIDPSLVAEGDYRIRSAAEVRARLEIIGGDTQSGVPGAVLGQPLRLVVKDEAGNPLPGVTVRFSSSPGARVTPSAIDTDANGMAQARLQLPVAEGIALVTAESLRQIVTFSARSVATTLQQFPSLSQSAGDPVWLAATASILRYFQNKNALLAPNGLADSSTLGQYLQSYCGTDSRGVQTCDGVLSNNGVRIVNLWRLPAFVGGALELSVIPPDLQAVRESIGAGDPVLLMMSDGEALTAIGVAPNGAVIVNDPSPNGTKRTLDEYLGAVQLQAGVRFTPAASGGSGFSIASWTSKFNLFSPAGSCGRTLETTIGRVVLRQVYCAGSESEYQLDLSGEGVTRAVVTDLTEQGAVMPVAAGSVASFRISRPGNWLVVTPQETTIATRGVVNAATFTSEIAPGSMIAVFGTGLARPGAPTKVDIGGRALEVLSATPFQVNAVIPTDFAPGSYSLRIETPYGASEQSIDVLSLAPAIFRAGESWAVVNGDGTLNGPATPAKRSQVLVVYVTGLGAIVSRNGLSIASAPVTVSIRGESVPVSYAGLAPGYPGLYQINLLIPASFPAGSGLPLTVLQGGVESSPANVAIQ